MTQPVPTPLPAVVLVRGCPRSGTTLAAELINTSPEAAIMVEYPLGTLVRDLLPVLAYETHFRASRRPIEASAPRAGKRSGKGRRAAEGAYPLRPIHPEAARFPTQRRLGAIAAAVVAASFDKGPLRIIGSKTPGAGGAGDRAALEPHFSTIKYVFVVRSPLGTINSMINRRNLTRAGADAFPWHDVAECIGEYRENVRQIFSHAAAYPGACFVLKYEDLVARFEATASALETFLGVRFDLDAHTLWGKSVRPSADAARLVLDAGERATLDAALGEAIASWGEKALTGPAESALDALHDCVDVLHPGVLYRYVGGGSERAFLGMGWSMREAGGAWSDGERADVLFRVGEDGAYVLHADAGYFLPEQRPELDIAADFDDVEFFRARVVAGAEPSSIVSGPHTMHAGRTHRLTLRVREPRSPAELGISADTRRISTLLRALQLEPV